MKLFTYFRSTAAYRVRIALNYKNLEHELIRINLLHEEHREKDYKKINFQGRVPTLEDQSFFLGQSSAILEYLEEQYPEPHLLPANIQDRAWIRYLSQIIISDIHPLNNMGALNLLKETFHIAPDQISYWYHHWLKQGFDTLEALLSGHPQCKKFCFGATPTFADICLIPQIYNAHRFEFSMESYPTLRRINKHCMQLPFFLKASPEHQGDVPSA